MKKLLMVGLFAILALVLVGLRSPVSAQISPLSGRYVLTTQTADGIGVLWVLDSQTGNVRSYTVELDEKSHIVYAEIPKAPNPIPTRLPAKH